jgi:hypothetical protein
MLAKKSLKKGVICEEIERSKGKKMILEVVLGNCHAPPFRSLAWQNFPQKISFILVKIISRAVC